MKSDKKVKIALGAFAIIMIFMLLLNRTDFVKSISISDVRSFIESKGSLGPIVYVVLLTLLPLLLFPDSVIVIAGGMAFGLGWGIILTSIGSLLGGMISFYISRYVGKDFVQKYAKDISMFKGKNNKVNGFFLIFILRLIPMFPFKVVSYSAGLTNVKASDFALATVIGSIPGIIVYTNLGDKSSEFGSSGFYISIALLVLLTLVSLLIKKRIEKKNEISEDIDKPESD